MLKVISGNTQGEQAYRAPDILWDGVKGDLAINLLTHPVAPGDFRAEQGLATQVLICLMTDRAADPSELPEGVENRGWPGDAFDLEAGETPLGSKLWLLRRQSLYAGIEIKAEAYIREALQPLLDQKAAVSISVDVVADRAINRMEFAIALYGRDGKRIYDQKFTELWDQLNGVANPLSV